MIPKECKRLAEVDFPIAEVSKHSAGEKYAGKGYPNTLHTAILIDLCKISIFVQLGKIKIPVLLDGLYEELVDLLERRMQMIVLPYIRLSQQPDIFDRVLVGRMGRQLDTGYRPLLGRKTPVHLMQEVDHGPLSMVGRSIPDQQQSFSRILALKIPDKVHRIF